MAAVFASLAAVSGADDIGSIAWRKLGAAEGFAGGSVAALLQDRRGYVWIGASGGLYRFDGLNFVRIGPPGGVFASISCLAEDGQGFIWAGSMGMGLGVYDPQKDVFQRIGAESAERSRGGGVVSLAIGKDGRALALWADGSLSVLSGETDAQGRALFSVADAGLSLDAGYGSGPLAVDISGKIWVGSESRGLRVFGPGGQLLGDYAHDPAKADSLGSSSIRILFEDSLGYLWVGLGDGGVDLYREGKFIHALAASPGGRGDIWCRYSGRGTVVSIAEDLKGRIWIGKEGGGLAVLEPSTMKISQEDGFSGRRVLAMMRDRRGLMWLGLERGGLLTGDHRSASVRRYAASADGQTLAAALGMGKSENGRPIVISRSGRIFGYDPYDDEFRVLSSPGAWVPLSSGGIARLP
ncbi:MAG TPA: two-component regulator propeller domain-containing protein, partial [Rectinemataceae bacterium]